MSDRETAADWALARVTAVRDDPAARLALAARTYRGPTGQAPRHLPFRRAAMSFMRWQAERGVLHPTAAAPPGSPWWRAVNERLLRDGCEAVASIVGNRGLAELESMAERFFLNVVLVRVLYAHALVAAPSLALGPLAALGPVLGGDPRLGMAGAFLSLRRVLPDRYPLAGDVETYVADEQSLGRMLDYGVIAPRLQRRYDWSAIELGHSGLRELIRHGSPTYAWPYARRHVWTKARMPLAARALTRATAPRRPLRGAGHGATPRDLPKR